MNICLIMDNPETSKHPVISLALRHLAATHTVRLLDVRTLTETEAIDLERTHAQADLYLLKSHASQALDLAHFLEQHGAVLLNSWAASLACQDRVLMAQRLRDAKLPSPQTWHFTTLTQLVTDHHKLASLSFPCIVKSQYSHRGDLVAKIDTNIQLQALAQTWGQEPVVIQAFIAGDSWDTKIWVIGEQVFAARRRTPLETNASKEDVTIASHDIPKQWSDMVQAIGRAFDLRLYGVDLLLTEHGPMIVDINSFPGFRGVPNADTALVTLIEDEITKLKSAKQEI